MYVDLVLLLPRFQQIFLFLGTGSLQIICLVRMAWQNRYRDPAFEDKIIDAFIEHCPWLQGEGYRKPTSVWGRIASELYSNTVRFRKWVYNFWREDRRGLRTKTIAKIQEAQMSYVCQSPEDSPFYIVCHECSDRYHARGLNFHSTNALACLSPQFCPECEATGNIGFTQDQITGDETDIIKTASLPEYLNVDVSGSEDPQSLITFQDNYEELADETDYGPVVSETDATRYSKDQKWQGMVDPLDYSGNTKMSGNSEEVTAKNPSVPQILSTEQTVGRTMKFRASHLPEFTITVRRSEWRKIYLGSSQSGSQTSWATVLRKKIQEHNKCCALTFKHHRVKRYSSRQGNVPFWSGKAKCKFTGCIRLYLTVQERPRKEARCVRISIKVKGEIRHSSGQEYQRHAHLPERHKRRKGLKLSPWWIKFLHRSDPDALITSNFNEVKCFPVSQNLSSEGSLEAWMDSSIFQDCLDVLEKQDAAGHFLYKTAHMYPQVMAALPFTLHMYTEEQLHLLWSLQRAGSCELQLDANGSVVMEPILTEDPILYYALCTKPSPGLSCILPITEMLTANQTTPNLLHWLASLVHDAVSVTGHYPKPQTIECGLRWALIHAVTWVFNEMTLLQYLLTCYELCVHNWTVNLTVIYIRAEHVTGHIASHVSKLKLSGQVKKFFLDSFALLQCRRTIPECGELIKHLSIIFGTKCLTEACRAAIHTVRRDLEIQKISIRTIALGLNDDILETLLESIDQKSIDQKSPFVKLIPPNDFGEGEEELINAAFPPNMYYSARLKKLLARHIATLPLWSRIMLQAKEGLKTRDTHSDAENWFEIVKHQVLKAKLYREPVEFVKLMKDTVQERLRVAAVDVFQERSPQKHFKKGRPLKNVGIAKDIQHPLAECWSGLPQSSPKKVPKYYSAPPVSLYQPGASDCPPQNGVERLNRRKKELPNTCSVDSLLYVIHMSMEQYPQLKKEIEALQSSMDEIDALARVNDAFQEKKSSTGRLEWLTQYERYKGKSLWDYRGAEEEVVALCLWHTIRDSTCDNQECPQKDQLMKSSKIAVW